MWVLWAPHVAEFVLLLSYTTFFCCDSLCSLPVSFSEETWGTGVLPKLGHTHSCCPDIHIILPFVSSNFLPSCQGKCLQRHHPVFKVANMYCSKGRSRMPSGDVVKMESYYTPAGINSYFSPVGSFGTLEQRIEFWQIHSIPPLLFILLFWQLYLQMMDAVLLAFLFVVIFWPNFWYEISGSFRITRKFQDKR